MLSFRTSSMTPYISFNTQGAIIATLTGFLAPNGLWIDQARSLYVADEGNDRIVVFTPPYDGSPTILNDPPYYPVGVSVATDGTIAASNIGETHGKPGNVAFYAKGATNPTHFVSSRALTSVYFCAFDAQGNLYVDGRDAFGKTLVGMIAGGINGTTITTLSTDNTISFPGGVAVTKQGLIAIDDQGAGKQSAVYSSDPPNKDNSLGSPITTTSLVCAQDAVSFAFTPAENDLLTADAHLESANLYAYPSGNAIRSVDLPFGGQPIGAALNPPDIP